MKKTETKKTRSRETWILRRKTSIFLIRSIDLIYLYLKAVKKITIFFRNEITTFRWNTLYNIKHDLSDNLSPSGEKNCPKSGVILLISVLWLALTHPTSAEDACLFSHKVRRKQEHSRCSKGRGWQPRNQGGARDE